ncbi:class I SAM-dependent methyltransferase [Desulfovibrio sp. OttesenSCG-928-C06]|nr:class I SAM-dependent methyltransferase [Desulfovibrio sp. OttesenSCG-928-C06]
MSAAWTEGYFTDAAYTHGYYREMCPAYIRFCLLAAGVLPPPDEDFSYCELAMGNGFSANIHAVSNPGKFSGMDFNPEHAAFAARLGARGQSGLAVCDDSFEDFLQREHTGYDYVCLHGGWSWISARNRELVIEFLKKHLKPGGVFYLSYNCHPGWTAAAPLRKLFKVFEGCCPGDAPAAERINGTLALTGEMLKAGPLFLNSSTWIQERFEALRKQPPEYLAHEFFNADWHIAYFSDVAKELAEAKLSFGASATVQNNIPGFGLTDEAKSYLERVSDPVMYQQLWDYFCNSQFRTDIFVRGAVRLNDVEQREMLAAQRFILTVPHSDILYSMDSGMGSFALDAKAHSAVAMALAADDHRPKTLNEIHAQLGGRMNATQIFTVLARLIGKAYAAPCQNELMAAAFTERCHVFNAEILRRTAGSDELGHLASPELGGGVPVPRLERMFLHALWQGHELAQFAAQTLEDNREQLTHNGKPVSSKAEIRRMLESSVDDFLNRSLPRLKALGIA